ncbi:MAG: four helix bundle protein [Ignavibacteriae bacterium]|nr:four helix bundle protein [Ignavibacteriota bacterium]
MAENIIAGKSFDFAIQIIQLYKKLVEEKEYVISKQLLRSGTSIGANVNESISAESKKDFISKLSISLKEARETNYWLMLLKESSLTNIDVGNYINLNEELIRLLVSIIKTSKTNLNS